MRLFSTALLLGASLSMNSMTPSSPTGVLTVSIVNVWGESIRHCAVNSLTDQYGHSLSMSTKTSTVNLPYGDYHARVECAPYLPADRAIAVREPHVYYIIGLKFAGIEMAPPSGRLIGQIKRPVDTRSWCKVTGIFTGDQFFSTVSPTGEFSYADLPVGLYSIVCRVSDDLFLNGTTKVTLDGGDGVEIGR